MKIFTLGTGDAFTEKRFNTCFILQSDNFNLAIECPHPYLYMLNHNKNAPKINEIDHFIISHMHADHMSGLETIAFYKKFVEKKILNLYASEEDYKSVYTMYEDSMGKSFSEGEYTKVSLNDYFGGFILNDSPIKIGPFTVRSRQTKHYISSRAMVINDGDYSVGYSGDTKFDKDLIEWFDKEADLIIHEVGPAPGHTPYQDLLSLPNDIKRRIRLIHYSDLFKTYHSELQCLYQGETYVSDNLPKR